MKNLGRLSHSNRSLLLLLMLAFACTDSQQLSPTPSALDLDDIAPSCPGLTSATVTAGPSLSLIWDQAGDNVSQTSAISYRVYIKRGSENYDLVSPSKIVFGATSTLVSTGITVGSAYTVFVTCSDEKGNTFPNGPANERTISVIDSDPPSQISDLSAGNATFSTVLLNWSPSDDGSGGTTASNMRYKIYGGTTSPVSTTGSAIATVTGSSSYLHTGLVAGTTWYYRVVAVDALDNLAPASSEVSATTVADVTSPTFTGSGPTISQSATTSSTVTLVWTAGSDNVTPTGSLNYQLYRCTGSVTCDPYAGTLVTTTSGGTVTYHDVGLNSSTAYAYGVRAVDGAGNVSTNTNSYVANTTYASSGSFYAYPTIDEPNFRAGSAMAVANVVGDATGASAFPDLLVGAPNASEPGSAHRYTGCVYVFPGTAAGTFSQTATQQFCSPNPSAAGTLNGLNFGSAIATGDLDVDGVADIVVSAPLRANLYIYRTVKTGNTLSIGTSVTAIGSPVTTPAAANLTFGTGLCLGDSDSVAGSGLDIFATVTAENCSVACGAITGTGNVMVFNNSSTAGNFISPNTVSYRLSPSNSLQLNGYTLVNGEVVARSCAYGNFDPNNTTESQLVIGSGTVAVGAGAVATQLDGMIAFYRKTGGSPPFTFQNVLPTTVPPVTGTTWGNALATIQLDTGTHELAVGAPADASVGTAAGAAFIYSVSSSPTNFSVTAVGDAFYGGSDFDRNAAGTAIAAGNLWGHTDGKQDFFVSSALDDLTNIIGANAIEIGQFFTHRNVSGVISATAAQNNFSYEALRAKNDQQFATALCRGDVNNDGREDVIVGVPSTDWDPISYINNTNMGAVQIYYGLAAGEINFVTPSQILYAPGAQVNSSFGNSCVVIDYNGDGQNDLLVGSPARDIGGVVDRGIVYVYQGSSNSALPAANTTSINSPTAVAAQFGWSLAKGDYDNNGAEDLAVGAIGITQYTFANAGAVYIYWGTTGTKVITSTNMITLAPPNGVAGGGTNPHLAIQQNTAATMHFGRALGTFRTVDGSTQDDLIVCTSRGDVIANEITASHALFADVGKCFIYENQHVASPGSNTPYTFTLWPKNDIRYPQGYSAPAATMYFGESLVRGDWNGDSVNDLIICSSQQRNLDTNVVLAGACWAYYGKSTGGFLTKSGYLPNLASRNTPLPDDVHYNPNPEAAASLFGNSVLLMDINNNGTQDLLIGEPSADNPTSTTNLGFDSGRLYIIRGGY